MKYMEITIRHYEERDRDALEECMNGQQMYLAGLDPLKQFKRFDDGGKKYRDWLVREVQKLNGAILMACEGNKVVGFIAGYVVPHDEPDRETRIKALPGSIQDIYVREEYQSRGIGGKLMAAFEAYLKSKGCDEVWVDAFIPNPRSVKFYEREGYTSQFVEMLKKI